MVERSSIIVSRSSIPKISSSIEGELFDVWIRVLYSEILCGGGGENLEATAEQSLCDGEALGDDV